MPLADLEALYRTVAAEVFAPGAGWGGALRQLAAGYRCEAGPLLTILRARFGEAAPMRGGARPRPAAFVCATSQDGAGRLELRILRTYDSPSASRGRDAGEGWRVWEACAATSAAPTLLPLFARADGSVWVDGALSGSNNPSLLVATEGLEFAAGAPVDTFLSLGCGDVGAPSGPAGATSNAGLLFWLNQALSLAFDSRVAEDRTRRLLEQASPRTRRVRLSPSPLAFALSEHRPAALAAMKAEVLAHLRARGGELRDLAAALRNDEGAPQPTAGAGEGEGKAPPPAQAAAALADGSAALPHEQLTAYQLL